MALPGPRHSYAGKLKKEEVISSEELSLLADRQFLLAKKLIDQKVTSLLLQSQQALIEYLEQHPVALPAEVSLQPRKIAKGENYQDMPYWVSDFPARLSKAHIWAFRTVVWWGHEISFSLILKGQYKPTALELGSLTGSELYYTLHTAPWQLEFSPAVQTLVNDENLEAVRQHYHAHDFVKLSIHSQLDQINQLPGLCVTSFEKIIGFFQKLA